MHALRAVWLCTVRILVASPLHSVNHRRKKDGLSSGQQAVYPAPVEKTVDVNGKTVCTSNCKAYYFIECGATNCAAGANGNLGFGNTVSAAKQPRL